MVCAYAEENIDAEILVFLDSDKCFFSEPKEFLLPDNCNVRVRPEYGQGIGSTGVNDVREQYWQDLYKAFGVERRVFVNTPIGNKKIRGYWNSGLVAVRRSAGIFRTWKENFEKAMLLNIAPPQGIYFVEQSVLSATICALEDNISEFSPNYSYPLPLHNRLEKQSKIHDFDDIVSIHYFNIFYYYDWKQQLRQLKNIDMSLEKSQWLYEGVARHNMPFKTVLHRHLLAVKAIQSKLNQFNININITNLIERLV
jgi:hypothetical protein